MAERALRAHNNHGQLNNVIAHLQSTAPNDKPFGNAHNTHRTIERGCGHEPVDSNRPNHSPHARRQNADLIAHPLDARHAFGGDTGSLFLRIRIHGTPQVNDRARDNDIHESAAHTGGVERGFDLRSNSRVFGRGDRRGLPCDQPMQQVSAADDTYDGVPPSSCPPAASCSQVSAADDTYDPAVPNHWRALDAVLLE